MITLSNTFSPHVLPVLFGWLRNRPTDEISDREGNVKVFVRIFMMQEVMASAELINPPVRKKPASRLMHFQMDLIPNRMVQRYDKHKHSGTYRGKPEQYDCYGKAFHNSFPEIQTNTTIFSFRHGVIVEHLSVLRVVLNGMARKDFFPQLQIFEKSKLWQFVHKFAVNLMLN